MLRILAVLLLCACEGTITGGGELTPEDVAPDRTLRGYIFRPRPRDAAPDSSPDASRPDAASPDAAPPPPPDAAPPPAPRHARCGWIGPGEATGVSTFVANASFFDVIHPGWYYIAADAVSLNTIADADNPQVVQAAQQNGVRIWPLVQGVGVPDTLRAMMNDPAKRAQHEQTMVNLAVAHGYVGLDIDYEGLWSASDRAPFEAFMSELAQAMHAQGKQLSAAVPALAYNVADSAFDYPFLADTLDALHMMGYDYHWLGGDHQGPVAPLGWVDAAGANAAATGSPAKFILGIPNYGVGLNYSCEGIECDAACGGSFTTVDTHMQSCPYGVWTAGRAPHCAYGGGTLYFDDLASQEEKVQSAHNHGLGGVTYWTVGKEHTGFFDMVRRYY